MLMRMPGSVGLYHAEAFTPAGEAEPPPVTLRLMHWEAVSVGDDPRPCHCE